MLEIIVLVVTVCLATIIARAAKKYCNKKPDNASAFDKYLEKAWPANVLNGRYGAIRAIQYCKIVASLRDGTICQEATNWATKRGIFLLNAEEGVLGVPAVKGQVVQSPPIPGSYRVVARVEDFETIIGRYHNNSTRHPGIQKTFSRVSVLCMRMQ